MGLSSCKEEDREDRGINKSYSEVHFPLQLYPPAYETSRLCVDLSSWGKRWICKRQRDKQSLLRSTLPLFHCRLRLVSFPLQLDPPTYETSRLRVDLSSWGKRRIGNKQTLLRSTLLLFPRQHCRLRLVSFSRTIDLPSGLRNLMSQYSRTRKT